MRTASLLLSLSLAFAPGEASAIDVPTGDPPPGAYERARADAARAENAGRWKDAAATLTRAIASFPEDFALKLELGYALLRGGQFAQAEAAYREALALNDASVDARWGLGDALLAQKRWNEAKTAYQAVLELQPEHVDARLGMARAVAGQQDWARVRKCTAGLLLEADRADVHALHALACFWLDDLHCARAHYERALALKPDDVQARLGLAWVAQRRGHTRTARAGFEAVEDGEASTVAERLAAREGLAALPPEHEVLVHAHGLLQSTGDHPVRGTESGVVAGVDVQLGDSWLLAGRFRHLAPLPGSSGTAVTFANDEGWGRLGLEFGRWHLAAFGAGVAFTPGPGAASTFSESGWMVGASARARAWADWGAVATWSTYPSGPVGQAEVGARLPLARWLALSAAARGQLVAGSVRFAGLGFVEASGARWALGAGGGYGAQVHPVELDTWALYNVPDEQLWRATVRGRVQVGRNFLLFASGDVEAWRTAPAIDSLLLRGAVGVGLLFPGG